VQDARSRITIVGAQRRVDVAVPSAAPIGEYVTGLADLCGQDRRDVLPAAWSLAPAAAPPLPLGASLADAGIVDGQVLYLRDAAGDPDDVPVVLDIDESVISDAERLRDHGVRRGLLLAGLGLLWMVATACLLWWMPQPSAVGAAAALGAGGVALILLGWGLEQRRAALPDHILLAMSLAAAPAFAAAGGLLGDAVGGSALRWPGALVGANLAVLLALSATPAGALIALELSLAVAALVAPALVAADADATQSAAAATVTALAVIALSQRIAALIAVSAPAGDADQLIARTRRLLLVVLLGPVVTLLVALPVLGRSGNAWAVALCVAVSVALLTRAAQAVVPVEAVALALAGAGGLFGVASDYVLRPSTAAWAVVLVLLAGLAAIGAGIAHTLSAPPGGGPREPTGPPRKRVADYVGLICLALSAPLALGALGVLGVLMDEGRQLFQ
jgi:type VII secretion integral membrane protein EccD